MISNSKDTVQLNQELGSILLSVIYFDIFAYPLTLDEIFFFSQYKSLTKDRLKVIIAELVRDKFLFYVDGYYMIQNAPGMVSQRMENQQRAARAMPKAEQMSRIISSFPYVRAVFISGSLSKNVLREEGDIDYFIITDQGRLWVTRTLLILFKKVFLLNSHKYFCVNYFVDDQHLEIEEKNIYTATEIATLLPMYGYPSYLDFFTANQWITRYFPYVIQRSNEQVIPPRGNGIRMLLEYILKGKAGNYLNRLFMGITVRYWRRKFKSMDEETFALAFKSTSGISKHHPLNFQSRVIELYNARIRTFEEIHKVTLNARY